jgi:hypothetical protein
MASKKRRNPRRVRAGDIVVVVLVLVAAVASLAMLTRVKAGEKGTLAIVEVNGKEARRFVLSSDQPVRKYTVRGWNGPSTFEIKNGRVHMVSSDCRDKICIGMGWADAPGTSIVCLPNRVVIRISGSRKSGKVDTVTE